MARAADAAQRLRAAGFLAADDEAQELRAYAGADAEALDRMLTRRLTGEPMAWITGYSVFCGVEVQVHHGVYVPRIHTEKLARRAAARLPSHGTAIDVCTGCGAIARVLMSAHPRARVLACDIDARAVDCARANGVETYAGDLFDALPEGLTSNVDLITAVVPYVPTTELPYLQRDTFTFEQPLAYDGGDDGMHVLRRVAAASRRFLKRDGALLLELGGSQDRATREELTRLGFDDVRLLHDEDGDVRGIEATRG
ncbi:MAG: class I SAM-dependent methyltransferase [Candidatus Dormibacteria bacterium]